MVVLMNQCKYELEFNLKRRIRVKLENYDLDMLATSINFLSEICNEIATDHGFWEDENFLLEFINNAGTHSDYPFSRLDRAKQKVISLFNSEEIALEISELAERLETFR